MKLSHPIILLASAASSMAVPNPLSPRNLATTLAPRENPIALRIFLTEYNDASQKGTDVNGNSIQTYYSWLFYDTTSGQTDGCTAKPLWEEPLSPFPSAGSMLPGGDFALEIAGQKCAYMNNGAKDNYGALWCGGHPNRCYIEDDAKLQRQEEGHWKTCREGVDPHTPAVQQLSFIRCELQVS